MTRKKTIYVPIEIKAREFYSQVLLATTVAEAGGRLYLGSKNAIFTALARKPESGGVLLYKGGSGNGRGFESLSKLVGAIAVLDQEMSPARIDKDPAARFLGNDLTYVSRHYFVQQEFADLLLSARPEVGGDAVRVFGWPRVDLWHPNYARFWEPEVKRIEKEYGEFVLFVSDFCFLHPEDVELRVEQARQDALYSRDSIDLDEIGREGRDAVKEFHQIVQFLHLLDSNPNFPPVVVRPHPSENHLRWNEALDGMRKTSVVFDGDVTPWLLASVALFHRGSTTAFQAVSAGKPVGFVRPEWGDCRNAGVRVSAFSREVRNLREAIELVESGNELPFDAPLLASPDGTASQKIADDLLALVEIEEEALAPPESDAPLSGIVKRAFGKVSSVLSRASWKKGFELPNELRGSKMPGGITAIEVAEVLGRLGTRTIVATQVANNLVCIERQSSSIDYEHSESVANSSEPRPYS